MKNEIQDKMIRKMRKETSVTQRKCSHARPLGSPCLQRMYINGLRLLMIHLWMLDEQQDYRVYNLKDQLIKLEKGRQSTRLRRCCQEAYVLSMDRKNIIRI